MSVYSFRYLWVVMITKLVINRAISQDNRAINLGALSERLRAQNRCEEAIKARQTALKAARKAVDWYRIMYKCFPEAVAATVAANLARSLNILGTNFSALNRHAEALKATQEGADLLRSLYKEQPEDFVADWALTLNDLCNIFSALNRSEEAFKTRKECFDLLYSLYKEKPKALVDNLALSLENSVISLNNLAITLGNLSERLCELNRCEYAIEVRQAALKATREGVCLYSVLCRALPVKFEKNLITILNNHARGQISLGKIFSALNRHAEALKATQVGVDLYRILYKRQPVAVAAANLARSLNILGTKFSALNRHAEALKATQEGVDLLRSLYEKKPEAFATDMAVSLNILGNMFCALNRHAEALKATQEGADLLRSLYDKKPEAFADNLAMSLMQLVGMFQQIGRREDAFKVTLESVNLLPNLCKKQPEAFADNLAMRPNDLGITFIESNTDEEDIEEAKVFADNLAMRLNDLGITFSKSNTDTEALEFTQKAVDWYRNLYQEQPEAFAADLAGSLYSIGGTFTRLNRLKEALKATQEAVDLYRNLYEEQPKVFAAKLANCLGCLGRTLSQFIEAGTDKAIKTSVGQSARYGLLCRFTNYWINNRREKALKATQEAVDLYRNLYKEQPQAFANNMAVILNNLGDMFSKLGRSEESKAAWNEAGLILVSQDTMKPIEWCQSLSEISSKLDSAENLRSIHLVAIQRIAKLRRLSYFDSTAGEEFIKLQAVLIADTWNKLEAASHQDSNLMDDAVVVLVSAMQSPDLMRWLADNQRNTPEGMALAHAEDEMRQANDALHLLYKRLRDNRGDDDGSPTMGMRKAPTAEQHKAIELKIEAAIEREAASRYCLENAQTALALQDPAFASAYEVPPVSELRFMLENLQTATSPHNPTKAALLCFLELPTNGQQPARLVGVMLTIGKAQVQQIEFPGLWDLAQKFQQFKPCGERSNATLRLLRDNDDSKKDDTAETLNFDSLFDELKKLWWTPLQAALGDDPVALSGVLHICSHGIAHQLPYSKVSYLELGGNLQLFQFPGLPYLRLAYSQGYAKMPTESTPSTSTNWQIAHNCAWNEAIPLPMVAVEASLLIEIIKKAQQSAEAIEDPKKVVNGKRGLVVCSHGTKAQGVNSAVHLTKGPLTTREVMSKKIGPEIALIPACHAADTADDHAHNALGVAAGFLLAGSKVVVGSIKAVPDTLMPWFSTLCVWYVVHEKLGLHAAAVRARQDFGAGEFPANFQTFVKEKLAEALSTLHPGDQEVERLGKPLPTPALLAMLRAWPWCGMNRDALVPRNPVDTANMKAATNAMASKAFTPRDGVAKMMREMAAFLVVFGIG